MQAGTVFDLGGLHVEVVGMAAHTAGTVGLLAVEPRVLLESDGANGHCWMFLKESLSIREYIAMLERTLLLEFDTFYTAHTDMPHLKAEMERYIRAARNASVEKGEPYSMFPELKPYVYAEDGVSVVFSERTLKGDR
jgi:glyoxylase-like metal-dependent hydrolase (beta-lactamase superfamily II)